jgi:formate-dependent nitrite reductase membrane component NrfD
MSSSSFPLTTKCNAEYDLVPAWANPALAVLALLTVSFLAMALAALIIRVKSRFQR